MWTNVLTPRGAFSPYRRTFLPDGRPALRKRCEPHHELTSPTGVAVDVVVLSEAEHLGCAGIVVERVRTQQLVWAPLSLWLRGIPVNRGYGSQRALRWSQLEPLPSVGTQLLLL